MNDVTYDVYGEEDKLFCRCVKEDGGRYILVGAQGHRIPYESLQKQIFNPVEQGRHGKSGKTKTKKASY